MAYLLLQLNLDFLDNKFYYIDHKKEQRSENVYIISQVDGA